jgi:signal transduction histidine kinase
MSARAEPEASTEEVDPDAGSAAGWRAWAPAVILAAFAVGLLAVVGWNLLRELSSLSVGLPPLIAAGIGGTLGGGLLYASAWLGRSELNPAARWRVAGVAMAGAAVFAGVMTLTMAVRAAEGRTVAEPQFVLFTAAGAGGIGGVLVGWLYAQARHDAYEAEIARDEAERAREEAEAAQRELEAAKRETEEAKRATETLLEQARRTRDDLELVNSVIRHDIKNSLMVIESRADFLADQFEDVEADAVDDRTVEFLETITSQAEEIEEQVDRAGAVIETLASEEPDVEPVPLGDALRSQVDTVRDSFDVAIEVDWHDVDPATTRVQANGLLPDVLGNVLTNAVAHHDGDNPTIEIDVTADGGSVTCRIADDGPGVADDRKEAVFRRGESSGEGGFGLFFVDRMLQEYGGSVHIEDSDLGGAAFVFEFHEA